LRLRVRAEKARQDVLEVDVHLLDAGVRGDLERRTALLDVDLHHAVVEFAGAQPFAEFLAGALGSLAGFGLGRHQQIEQALLGVGARRDPATSSRRSSRTMSMAMSTRSRIMASTSRPT
jgi:hypothetical protein